MTRVLARTTRRAPQTLARVRPGHPLAKGLIGAYSPYTANTQISGNAAFITGVDGLGFYCNNNSEYFQVVNGPGCVSTNPTWTILCLVNAPNGTVGHGGDRAVYCERPTNDQIIKVTVSNNPTQAAYGTLVIRDAAAAGLIIMDKGGTFSSTVGGRSVITAVRRGTTDHRIFINGVNTNSDTSTTVPFNFATCDSFIGHDPQDTSAWLENTTAPLILTWNRALSDGEIRQISGNPWQLFHAPKRVPFFTGPLGGGGTTYTITPSGGFVLSGTAAEIRGRVFGPTGGVTFGGSAPNIRGNVIGVSGGVAFTGTAPITFSNGATTYTIVPTGGFVLSGTAPNIRGNVIDVSGGVAFSGTATMIRGKAYVPTGGVSFSGTNVFVKTNVIVPTGGVIFSGTAPITFNGNVPVGTAQYLPLLGAGR